MKTRIQTRLAAMLTAMLLMAAFYAHAQEKNFVPYPYAFIGIQGGGQTTFTDYNAWKLTTPTASFFVGVHFTPAIAARLHINGIWNKSGIKQDDIDATYKYTYTTGDIDLMINMVNLLDKSKNYHKLNAYLIGGVGLNYAWDNEEVPALHRFISTIDSRNRLSHNFRVGAMLDYNFVRNWSVNLEVAANSLCDRYNSQSSGGDDWQLTAQVGLAYKFGVPHNAKSSRRGGNTGGNLNIKDADNETVSADMGKDISKQVQEQQPTVTPAVTPTPEEPKNISRNIFFTISSAEISSAERPKLEQVAEWLKKHPNAKVSITGYADKGTGTSDINARIAKKRAEVVAKELTKKYGIAAKRITTDSKGDTVQPFKDNNDLNRVAIVIAE